MEDRRNEQFVARGAFSLGGKPQPKPANVAYRIGYFNEIVPRFLSEQHDNISFMHVDCDLYSSAVYVLKQCLPRFRNGTVHVFDELVNYPEFKQGEIPTLYVAPRGRGIGLRIIGHVMKQVHGHPNKEYSPQAAALQLLM